MSDVEGRPLDRFMARKVGQIDDGYLTESNLETTTHHHVSQEADSAKAVSYTHLTLPTKA